MKQKIDTFNQDLKAMISEAHGTSFEEMATWRIFWGLYKRHETFLLYLALVVTLTYKLVRSGL